MLELHREAPTFIYTMIDIVKLWEAFQWTQQLHTML